MEILPRWDMGSMYGNVDTPKFENDIRRMKEEAKSLSIALDEGKLPLRTLVERYEKLLDIDETLSAFASAMRTTDTTSALYAKATSRVEAASLETQKLEVKMLKYLKLHQAEVEKLTAKGGGMEQYAYVLKEACDEAGHLMDDRMEALASDLSRSGTDAFSRLQENVSSNASVEWVGGERKTVTELRGYAFSPDRVLRGLAFKKEISILDGHKEAFAACLNGVKGATITLDEGRGYASPLARSLSDSRIDDATFHALLSTLEGGLGMFRRYLDAKAKVLHVDELAFYDLFAPVGKGGKVWSYAEAKAFVIRQLSAFSPKMGAFVTKAFERNWIDPEAHSGKVGGAYDTAFPLFGESRVLSNFDHSYSSVSTLAHELGHAFHDSIVLPQSHLLRTYPMTLAESASLFSEFVVLNGALAESGKEERLTLEEHFIQDACQVCVDILCRFYFEDAVFAKRKEGELTADEFSSLMVDCQERTYGKLSDYHPYMWAVKSHYYSSDFSYYNYPYAFGQLFALGLYGEWEKDKKGFEEKYVRLLSLTGRMSAMDVAASIGIDLRSRDFWQQGMDVIASFVDRFVRESEV